MKTTIPFSILPTPIMRNLSVAFKGLGFKIAKTMPLLKLELKQAELDFKVEEYAAIMVLSTILYFFLFTAFSIMLLTRFMESSFEMFGYNISEGVPLGLLLGVIGAGLIFFQMSMYPKIQIKKKVRSIEANLVYSLRTMLVQIRSGISLFDSLSLISDGDFGQLSVEFKKAVDEISTGVPEKLALQNIATNNPSPHVRKVVWQIVNGMKAGGDVADVLVESVASMTRQQEIEIEKYGSSLRLLSLIYMMIGVIIPALGLTFLIVLGSFPKIEITEMVFWMLLGGVLVAEFMFIGIIKSKRPNLMSA